MNKEEGKKLLEKYRTQMTAARQHNEDAFAQFDNLDDVGVDLLGPTTELAKRRIIKEMKQAENVGKDD